MRRTLVNVAAFAFGLALPLLMAQVGGFPSRPRFFAVGVNTPAPATAGTLSALANSDATITGGTFDNDSNGAANLSRLVINSGDASLSINTAGSGRTATVITNGPTGAQAVLRTLGAHPILFGTNQTLAVTIAADQSAAFEGLVDVFGSTLEVENASPTFQLRESDQGADGKIWRADSFAGALRVTTRTDAGGAGEDAFNCARSGTVVTLCTVAADDVTLNANTDDIILTATDAITATGASFTFAGNPVATSVQSNYTGAVTGCTTDPAPVVQYTLVGGIVSLHIPSFSCTSNATGFTITGAPVEIRTQSAGGDVIVYETQNNTVQERAVASAFMGTTGILTFKRNGTSSGWTGSGTKGVTVLTVTYPLNTN